MAFEQQAIGAFLEAREEASGLLIQETERVSRLSLIEGMMLQAASHVLLAEPAIYGTQISRMTNINLNTVLRGLKEFESIAVFIQAGRLESQPRGTRPILFTPTELGSTTLDLFQGGSPNS